MRIRLAGGVTHRRMVVLLSASLLFPSSGCAPIGFPMQRPAREIRYCSEYRDYRKANAPKAWAVAGDPCGVFVSGFAYEEPDPQTAEARALMLCEARRSDRRVAAPCVLHAWGDCAMPGAELRYCRSLPDTGDDCPDRLDPQQVTCAERSSAD